MRMHNRTVVGGDSNGAIALTLRSERLTTFLLQLRLRLSLGLTFCSHLALLLLLVLLLVLDLVPAR